MKWRTEKLGDRARVSVTVLKAYLTWARDKWPDALERLHPHLEPEDFALVSEPPPEPAEILFRDLVRVARAIAAAAGGEPEATFYALGCHSAALNLAGAYKTFSPAEPHRFFETMSYLHRTFQSFGRSSYEKISDRSGRIHIEGYDEFSPSFCESGRGYYEEALRMMKAPGPIHVAETECQCAGDPACVFELRW